MNDSLKGLVDRFDPTLPLERASTIPADWYKSPALYAQEVDSIFRRHWLWGCETARIREAGQFVTREIAGERVLFVRSASGRINALSNVCRHRAAPVAPAEAGRATRFRCPYHGWTYGLDGELLGTPEFDGVADFCRSENGLRTYRAAEWGPWTFLHLSDGDLSLADHLGAFARAIDPSLFDDLELSGEKTYFLECNWKVFVDNYLDGGYHVNVLHPDLGGVLDYANYVTVNEGMTSLQSSPLKADRKGIAGVRQGKAAQYWWIYPNLMINLYEGIADINVVYPTGPTTCAVYFGFWFSRGIPDADRRKSLEVADQVQREDQFICEAVQRGLTGSAYDTGRYSVRRESGAYHFHRLLHRDFTAGERKSGV